MIAAGVLIAACCVLVVVHMTRIRYRRREVSAARFFRELPRPRHRQHRLELTNPLRSLPLYPQASVLLLVLASLLPLLLSDSCGAPEAEKSLGLWVLVDTSYSMTTLQGGQPRLGLARQEALRFLERVESQTREGASCLRLSGFDMEVRELLPAGHSSIAFRQALQQLVARPLGSELSVLRQVLAATAEAPGERSREAEESCQLTHRLVISDLPAPDWLQGLENQQVTLIWRDISQPVDNAGIGRLLAERDLLGGTVRAISVEAVAWGRPPVGTALQITAPDGAVMHEPVAWLSSGVWRYRLRRPHPGLYRFALQPGGAYAGDDQAAVAIPAGSTLTVDWRLRQTTLAQRLGWRIDAHQARLRVAAIDDAAALAGSDLPLLVVGDRYGRSGAGENQITRLEEGDPLLEGLNLDVAEGLSIAGVTPPPGFDPVLAGGGGTWVARRVHPPGVYLPGLPAVARSDTQEALQHFSTSLLCNAVRWLLGSTAPPPLYTLTDPAHPEPAGTRLALHPDEGRTDHSPASRGNLENIRPLQPRRQEMPAWPWLLSLACLCFALEQGLATFGGERWR